MNSIAINTIACIVACTALSASAQQNAKMEYPVTKKTDHVDLYFGTKVADPYRWLENDTAADVAEWVKAQNQFTDQFLSQIPYRDALKKRITDLVNYPKYGIPEIAGNYYIYSKNDGLQNQAVFYYRKKDEKDAKVFIDPNKLAADGTAAVTLMGASGDNRYMAYAVNQAGSDWQTIHVMEIADAKKLNDELKWVKFSSVAWHGNGFYYSRFSQGDEATRLSRKNENHQIWFHKLGTPQSDDALVFNDPAQPLQYFFAQVTEDEKFLIIYKSQGTYGTEILIKDLQKAGARPELLFKGFNYEYSVLGNSGDDLFVLTDENAPNKHIIKVNAAEGVNARQQTVVPHTQNALESATMTGGFLFCNYLENVSSTILQYTPEGQLVNRLTLPAEYGNVTGFSGRNDSKETFYSFTSFTYPTVIYKYTIGTKKSETFFKPELPFRPEDFVTEQVFYPSKDGTKIPMYITFRKGFVRTGDNPTLLYAYGGFNANMIPSFSASRIAWLEKGGIYAQANLRGGGEYGEEWHKAGMLFKKQNVFDDFIAAAEYLINKKYTSSQRLAIMGGSNGGLLIGAVTNQRPELFKVAIPQVGVMDMLRYHKFTIGYAWAVEYGSSDSLNHFNNIYKYSPLHNIKKQEYPAIMVTTADHDDRVVPAHSFKYIATLQEQQQGPDPVLIRISVKAGHGAGKPLSKIIEEVTDIYSFIWYNMEYNPRF